MLSQSSMQQAESKSAPGSALHKGATITTRPIEVRWNPSKPIFAKPEFLEAVGDEYGWLGGFDDSDTLRCILPYTVVRKAGLRLVRFRVETISTGPSLDVAEEQLFLNDVVRFFRAKSTDAIIPASNNTLFRTYPTGAKAAPYGTYVIDLTQPEEVLWRNISKTSRQNITAAQKDGVTVRESGESLDSAYDLIVDTFRRSKMSFMSRGAFKRFAHSLGENCKILAAEHNGIAQSYSLFAFSEPSAFWVYGGNISNQHSGAMKLLQWEAIRIFRNLGVRNYDLYGARIDPPKGSKQEGINKMKKHLGAKLINGYMWKYSIRPGRSWLYTKAVKVLRGGDLVDQEEHKLQISSAIGA